MSEPNNKNNEIKHEFDEVDTYKNLAIQRLCDWVAPRTVKYPFITLLLVLIPTVFAGYYMRNLWIDPAVEKMLQEHERSVTEYDQFVETFGSDEFVALTFRDSDTMFKKGNLELITRLTDKLTQAERIPRIGDKDYLAVVRSKKLDPGDEEILQQVFELRGKRYEYRPNVSQELRDKADAVLAKTGHKIKTGKYIDSVLSLSNVKDIRTNQGSLLIEKIMAKIPETPEAMQAFHDRIFKMPFFVKSIISEDGKTTSILARFKTKLTNDEKIELNEVMQAVMDSEKNPPTLVETARLNDILANKANVLSAAEIATLKSYYTVRDPAFYALHLKENDDKALVEKELKPIFTKLGFEDFTFYLGGPPILQVSLIETLQKVSKIFGILSLTAVAAMAFVEFRSIAGLVLPIATVTICVVWTLGFMSYLGIAINLVSVMLVFLVTVTSVSCVIHVISRYYEDCAVYADKKTALTKTISYVGTPIFYNSLTTALGFGSLMTADIVPVKEFGMFSAFGVMASFVVSITLLPAILRYLPKPSVQVKAAIESGPMNTYLSFLGDMNIKYRYWILAFSLMLYAIFGYGITLIEADAVALNFFKDDNPIKVTYNFIQKNMSGLNPLELSMDTGRPDGIKEPQAMQAVEDMKNYILKINENGKKLVDVSLGASDFIKEMNKQMHDGDDARFKVPDSKKEIAEYILLYSMSGDKESLESFMTFDYSTARISSRIQTIGQKRIILVESEIQKYVKETLSQKYKVYLSEKNGVVNVWYQGKPLQFTPVELAARKLEMNFDAKKELIKELAGKNPQLMRKIAAAYTNAEARSYTEDVLKTASSTENPAETKREGKFASINDVMIDMFESLGKDETAKQKIGILYNFTKVAAAEEGDDDDDEEGDADAKPAAVQAPKAEHKLIGKLATSERMLKEYIDSFYADPFGGIWDMKVVIAGMPVIYNRMYESLVYSQAENILTSLAAILFCMIVLFRSLKIGLLSMWSNLLTVVMGLGVMGFLGIKLDINTIMIASISIGIAVDDTIHFITRYKVEYLKGATHDQAQKLVLQSTGRAIVYTSINLALGFLIACVSDFKPQINMGILGCFTMTVANIWNTTVLPCALIVFKPKFKAPKGAPLARAERSN